MRTTVTLEDDVYEAAEALARALNKPLGKVLSDLIRRGLRPAEPVMEEGFPVFQVPPDAPMIPGSRVRELLDEEGAD